MSKDIIYRQDAIDAVKKNTFRLTFAEEQNCEGHVAWRANAVYSDVIEGALLELPSAQPERKKGKWIEKEDPYGFFNSIPVCSECGCTTKMRERYNFCPNCGADMRGEEE